MENSVEIAKSYFVLAQIFAVLVGLFIVASSLVYVPFSDRINLVITSADLCKNYVTLDESTTLFNCSTEILGTLTEEVKKGDEIVGFFFGMALIFSFGSFFCWLWGRLKLNEEYLPDTIFIIGLILWFLWCFVFLFLKYKNVLF